MDQGTRHAIAYFGLGRDFHRPVLDLGPSSQVDLLPGLPIAASAIICPTLPLASAVSNANQSPFVAHLATGQSSPRASPNDPFLAKLEFGLARPPNPGRTARGVRRLTPQYAKTIRVAGEPGARATVQGNGWFRCHPSLRMICLDRWEGPFRVRHAIIFEPDDNTFGLIESALAEISWEIDRATTPDRIAQQALMSWAVFLALDAGEHYRAADAANDVRAMLGDIAIVGLCSNKVRTSLGPFPSLTDGWKDPSIGTRFGIRPLRRF